MKSPYFKLLIASYLGIFILLNGCGKVVQQSTASKKNKPTFSLSITLENIMLMPPPSTPTTNQTPSLLQEPKQNNQTFTHKMPIILLLKGYTEDQSKTLAWGKGVITTKKTASPSSKKPSQTHPNLTQKKETPTYTGTVYDSHNIKVKSAKESQFEGTFKSNKKQWIFTTKKVTKTYPYYISVAYGSASAYHLKIIDQKIVSQNKTIAIEPSPLDTFHAILFINAFRTIEFEHNHYKNIHHLFDTIFFQSLQYVFPPLNIKALTKKSRPIKLSDPIIDYCIKLLELSLIDIKETEAYIKNLDKKYFTDTQKKILLTNIKTLKPLNH